ncbi:MAG: diguanylate cyclase [Gemmatimonadota bacterium]|nr:diguanylate cyclase [Gemmatimonadota bacterium]
MSSPRALYLSPQAAPPAPLETLVDSQEDGSLTTLSSPDEVEQALARGIVELVVVDADHDFDEAVSLCSRMKSDPFNSVVPVVFHSRRNEIDQIEVAFESGADEFLNGSHSEREQRLRLAMVLERAARDVSLNPTTMLPGTRIIQHEISRRVASGEKFAVCYADIDAFKEFNDKYSYHRGDRVIWIVSMILRDIVRRLSPRGFVGHVGGDDFIFTVPVDEMRPVSEKILDTFDTLMPLQYTEEDRERGYFLAEDRQGNVRRIGLMTLSIGCVTNVKRIFTHPGRVSELASEMKSYAKTLPGSVFVVDRRSDRPLEEDAAASTDEPGGAGGDGGDRLTSEER